MDRERVANVLGMLGSAHDGEVVNAGRLAVRLLRDAGITRISCSDRTASPSKRRARFLRQTSSCETTTRSCARSCTGCAPDRRSCRHRDGRR